MKYIAYTDGSSRGNPGPAGWGCIIMNEGKVREYNGAAKVATNNQMEIMGVLYAMNFTLTNLNKESIDTDSIEIFSDSQYVVKGCTEWVHGWVRNNWKTSQKKDVLNVELWKNIWQVMNDMKYKKIEFKVTHVRGHNGNIYNERADVICTSAALNENEELFSGSKDEYEKFLDKKFGGKFR
jgi:ribonuclease HI